MQEKTITVTTDASGDSALDPEGFTGHGCEKVSDDFRGGDAVKVEQKKPAYYTGHVTQQEKIQH
jgi:hypothetical protein